MARPDPAAKICEHLAAAQPGQTPFVIDIELDDAGGMTDAVVRCSACGASYLIELLSWRGSKLRLRTFRVSTICEADAAIYRRDIARGSCDLSRAGAERTALEQQTKLTSCIVELDVDGLRMLRLEDVGADADISVASWRTTLL